MPKTAFSPSEIAVNDRLGTYMDAARAGTVKPTPWVAPDRRPGAAEGPIMSFIRGALGRPDAPPPAAKPALTGNAAAWLALTEQQRAEALTFNRDWADACIAALPQDDDEEDEEIEQEG